VHNCFTNILTAKQRKNALGICSICSANKFVLQAAFKMAKNHGTTVLIESTSNQVDQFGGYTGMTPQQFVEHVSGIALTMDFPVDLLILGGDHLGPNVWQNESSQTAMEKARDQIHAYVTSGYRKIHLDTSMRCADDRGDQHTRLGTEIIAERAADLCWVAEQAYNNLKPEDPEPIYVIGSDVPLAGGAQEELAHIDLTAVEDVANTIELTQKAFYNRGLHAAWDRVLAVVVQPGVEFGDTIIIEYDREKARPLSEFIETYDKLIYEAHSTDYQKSESLRQMVQDHFAILKVGPWLTFALREAVFALALMESEWLGLKKGIVLSDILQIIDDTMLMTPSYWRQHYSGDESHLRFLRKYSYSDRIRYFWPNKTIAGSLDRLFNNIEQNPIPLCLLSQYMPVQYNAVRQGELDNNPLELIYSKIHEVINKYNYATGTVQKNNSLRN
jgi:D-tagatose-1,6-bisphosphate aldolase subunit GatZ/KbaZ